MRGTSAIFFSASGRRVGSEVVNLTRLAFAIVLLGMAHEKLGNTEKAEGYFAKAGATTGHNPPAAFARYYTRSRK